MYQSRIKVWTYSCETNDAPWRPWLRKPEQTLKRKRTGKQRLETYLLKKTIEKQIGGGNLMRYFTGNSSRRGVWRAQWLLPPSFMTGRCSRITTAPLTVAGFWRTRRTEGLPELSWSPLFLLLQHRSQRKMSSWSFELSSNEVLRLLYRKVFFAYCCFVN